MPQPIHELSDRRREIFGLVVDAYLERGLPVAAGRRLQEPRHVGHGMLRSSHARS